MKVFPDDKVNRMTLVAAIEIARAAALALLEAWPYRMGPHPVSGFTDLPAIILPLPQENTDAEA